MNKVADMSETVVDLVENHRQLVHADWTADPEMHAVEGELVADPGKLDPQLVWDVLLADVHWVEHNWVADPDMQAVYGELVADPGELNP